MKKLLTVLVAVFALPMAFAACEDILQYETEFEGVKVSSYAPYKNEVANVYNFNESYIGSVTIKDGTVTDVYCEEQDKASYYVAFPNEKIYEEFVNTNDPLLTVGHLYYEGQIDIDGQTFVKSMKLGATNAVVGVTRFFKNLF